MLQGWTVSKPITMPSGAVLLPYTKIGTYVQTHERQCAWEDDESEPPISTISTISTQNARRLNESGRPAASGFLCRYASASEVSRESSAMPLAVLISSALSKTACHARQTS